MAKILRKSQGASSNILFLLAKNRYFVILASFIFVIARKFEENPRLNSEKS